MDLLKLEMELSKEYLVWDNGVYTKRHDLLPVVDVANVVNCRGENVVRVNYCFDLSAKKIIRAEDFPNDIRVEELADIIRNRMKSDEWYGVSSCYNEDNADSLITLVGFIKLKERYSNMRKLFSVYVQDYIPAYQCGQDTYIETNTCFDISVPTRTFELFKWYDFELCPSYNIIASKTQINELRASLMMS